MDKIVNEQSTLFKRISNLKENMMKLGKKKITRGVITSRIDLLESYWTTFSKNDAKINAGATEEIKKSLYFTEDYLSLGEEAYLNQKADLLDQLDALPVRRKADEQSGTDSDETDSSRGRTLQKIALPTFAGDYQLWPSFRDLFISLIIKNSSLSAVDKLHYLKSSLSGEAARVIQNVTITANNFKRAWLAVSEQYDVPRLLIHAQLKALMSLPAMSSASARELKDLLHGTQDAVEALETLHLPVQHWSAWLVYLTAERLDAETRKDWETSLGTSKEHPTFQQLLDFLRTQVRAALASEFSTSGSTSQQPTGPSGQRGRDRQQPPASSGATRRPKTHCVTRNNAGNQKCALCAGEHFILYCPSYQALGPRERKARVIDRKLCFNCLAMHSSRECKSTKRCQLCLGKHHTTIHIPVESVSAPSTNSQVTQQTGSTNQGVSPSLNSVTPTTHCAQTQTMGAAMLLATALVRVATVTGEGITVRALIDPCSEVSLIGESIAQLLKLPRTPTNIPVIGVAKCKTYSKGAVTLTVSHRKDKSVNLAVQALVLPRLSSYQPSPAQLSTSMPHLKDLELADPEFLSCRKVDLLLGAEVYSQIILEGLKHGPPRTPVAQATTLGWILTGPITDRGQIARANTAVTLQCSTETDISELLQRFWAIEEVSTPFTSLNEDEKACEEHFAQTHTRDDSGRYVVRLPFSRSKSSLGLSRAISEVLLQKLEKRFRNSSELETAYCQFMDEYESLDHMSLATGDSRDISSHYYLPHHGVIRVSSTTTKLRVVFNASCKTTSGLSLNDLVHKGPNLLPEIFDILLRWRLHAVVFSADIEKMYRQIRVHTDDCDFQRILWRKKASDPVKAYRLLTVTYGMACAPYLAIRTLKQLSADEIDRYPSAAPCLLNDVYMDDVISGADTISAALHIQKELLSLLKAGGFKLRKWASNSPELLKTLPLDYVATTPELSCNFEGTFSLLGLKWQTTSDCFLFSAAPKNRDNALTKRVVFRETASLYDPLGFLAPVIIAAKIFVQSLWLLKLGWDEPLPLNLTETWERYYNGLGALSSLRIPRWLAVRKDSGFYELHGFADASITAYAAVIYLRSLSESEPPRINLVAAKTRVAPLKQISLPRLELCAATLLARLTIRVLQALNLPRREVHLWSDSTIVLSWLQKQPSQWTTFVANRVSEIQTTLPNARWHHIRTKENPADCASRGIQGDLLKNLTLWWQGPCFLKQGRIDVEFNRVVEFSTTEEARSKSVCHMTTKDDNTPIWEVIVKYSSYKKLNRITAWCLRFISLLRRKSVIETQCKYITAPELEVARLTLIRLVQRKAFAREISNLENSASISRGPLARLVPFVDAQGILRVGGRLKHSTLDFDEKHPIILPEKGTLTLLIVRDHHERALHGGTQLTLSTLRQTYWILRGRRVVRTYIHTCVTCWRWRAKALQQRMGDLPLSRVTATRPFLNTGVDYAGPFHTKISPGRGYRTRKSYVAVFICLATKALHLELVSDYTTAAFLAAYRRFVSRRGHCASMRSDRGTNFVGADKELRQWFSTATSELGDLAPLLADMGTKWVFNPPAAPHFGGIWEAAVKSMKFHLRRVIGDTPMTFEEMATLLTQIEACLNSRPLIPLSDEPDDFNFLTPSHFLVGSSLIAVPEPSLAAEPRNRLSRWQFIQQMRDHYWQRWAAEYLQTLQSRNKWVTGHPNVQVGDLCLLRNEATPPTHWPIGRITAVHPGKDDLVRVVTIRTAYTTLQRPIAKISVFPSASSDSVPTRSMPKQT
ncbi:uncharacterized protein LOC143374875 [Andrena cerasifolii]|uniref:uncharacterized protein LOC143374875 n=1 Tax=Andrena cerasifolii TaxID=2819439 RepID=UPI004037DA54